LSYVNPDITKAGTGNHFSSCSEQLPERLLNIMARINSWLKASNAALAGIKTNMVRKNVETGVFL
jgi:hypothetical protein